MSNTSPNSRRREPKRDENLSWFDRIIEEGMKKEEENQRSADTSRWESRERVEKTVENKVTIKDKNPYCVYCGTQIHEGDRFCRVCGNVIMYCTLCKRYLFSWENVLECPNCGATCHRDHLLEWIKVKGCCPNCEKRLNQSEVI
ncbi:MAG: zinc-ribbon domain-containing protein [Candidatus Freyarchaeum deiterrae]